MGVKCSLSKDADKYKIQVLPGDILILGSDGLFDNMWNEDLVDLVDTAMLGLAPSEHASKTIATAVALAAHQNAANGNFRSPWTVGATAASNQVCFASD